jgi:hypothetical protein
MAESTGEMNTCRENNFGAHFVVIMHAYYEQKSFCYKLHNDTLRWSKSTMFLYKNGLSKTHNCGCKNVALKYTKTKLSIIVMFITLTRVLWY